jgi:hypothetical protein
MDFRGFGPHRPDELEDQCCRHHTRRYGAHDRDNTPGDCWEGRSSLLGGRQRDPSGAAGVIVAPWILFATLGGIMDGKCIYCTDRSVGATTLLVSWTLPPFFSGFSCVVLVLVVVST